jgi:hypothetical protein
MLRVEIDFDGTGLGGGSEDVPQDCTLGSAQFVSLRGRMSVRALACVVRWSCSFSFLLLLLQEKFSFFAQAAQLLSLSFQSLQ